MDKINNAHNKLNITVLLYLWFADGEITSKDLKSFLMRWEKKLSFKTIVKQGNKLSINEFIFFDIIPNAVQDSSTKRFSYKYFDTNKILNGVEEFYNVVSFTLSEKPFKKQKRNDYED
jgi:hypothetical protein